jgi:beta-1,4-mannosyl-glycoprotein beta-1,4-N-acetylglucosaminyltransferase
MFSDEEMLLDLRLNILDKYIHKFIITEAKYKHNGEPKKLCFNINKFKKFKEKITYIVVDKHPPDIEKVNKNDNEETINAKTESNAYKRHIYQLEQTQQGTESANPHDFIIIGDLDEIPNLENINFEKVRQKIIFFKQKMFYYKLNLYYKMPWYGSRACKKKYLKSAKWLQWMKNKKYPLWRIDILFSNKKYNDVCFVPNGGWHFTDMKSPEDIEKKLKGGVHYKDFLSSGINANDIKKIISEKRVMYNHQIDKKENKWRGGEKLQTLDLQEMPKYVVENYEIYKPWLDSI